MGNNAGKTDSNKLNISSSDLQILKALFEKIGGGKKITEPELNNFWCSHIDSKLLSFITCSLFNQKEHRSQHIDFNAFAELYAFTVESSVTDKANVIFACCGVNTTSQIPYVSILAFVESIISSFIKLQHIGSETEYISWEKGGYLSKTENIQRYAENLTHDIKTEIESQAEKHLHFYDIEKWLGLNPTFLNMMEGVFYHLYQNKPNSNYGKQLVPLCVDLPPDKFLKILDISHVLFVNSNLPMDLRSKWRFLFSSKLHGESFSTLMGRIINKGPCIIFVEDEDGYLFGGFASHSLHLSPNFVGNENAFLFGLVPNTNSFSTTGYNNHYQYLNLHQQTMPNGLGMGGQFEYWGLWLDSEYGLGSSADSCTTFRDYKRLSSNKKFQIRNIEVWAVGELIENLSDDDTRGESVLDRNAEDKAMLEMIGRGALSDGLRDKPDDLE